MAGFHPTIESNLRTALGVEICKLVLLPAFGNRFQGLASLILMSKYAQSWQFFVGFPDNILQGWFKMKTTSIFPVHGLAS